MPSLWANRRQLGAPQYMRCLGVNLRSSSLPLRSNDGVERAFSVLGMEDERGRVAVVGVEEADEERAIVGVVEHREGLPQARELDPSGESAKS